MNACVSYLRFKKWLKKRVPISIILCPTFCNDVFHTFVFPTWPNRFSVCHPEFKYLPSFNGVVSIACILMRTIDISVSLWLKLELFWLVAKEAMLLAQSLGMAWYIFDGLFLMVSPHPVYFIGWNPMVSYSWSNWMVCLVGLSTSRLFYWWKSMVSFSWSNWMVCFWWFPHIWLILLVEIPWSRTMV